MKFEEVIAKIKSNPIYVVIIVLAPVLSLIITIIALLKVPLFVEFAFLTIVLVGGCLVLIWAIGVYLKSMIEKTLRPSVIGTEFIRGENLVYDRISEMFSNLSSNEVIIYSSTLPFVVSPSFIGLRKAVSHRAKVSIDSIKSALNRKVRVIFLFDPKIYVDRVKRLLEKDENELPFSERIETIKKVLDMMRNGMYSTLEIVRRPAGLLGMYVISQRAEAIWPYSLFDSEEKVFDTAIYCTGEKIGQLFNHIYKKVKDAGGGQESLEKRIEEIEKILQEIETYLRSG